MSTSLSMELLAMLARLDAGNVGMEKECIGRAAMAALASRVGSWG